MNYVDMMVYSAPAESKAEVVAFAQKMDALFMEFGALRILELWGEDVPPGKQTDFYRAVAAPDGEVVCGGIIEWPDKATREAAFAKMHTDERFQAPMPFNAKRMIFGGFEPIVDLKA